MVDIGEGAKPDITPSKEAEGKTIFTKAAIEQRAKDIMHEFPTAVTRKEEPGNQGVKHASEKCRINGITLAYSYMHRYENPEGREDPFAQTVGVIGESFNPVTGEDIPLAVVYEKRQIWEKGSPRYQESILIRDGHDKLAEPAGTIPIERQRIIAEKLGITSSDPMPAQDGFKTRSSNASGSPLW